MSRSIAIFTPAMLLAAGGLAGQAQATTLLVGASPDDSTAITIEGVHAFDYAPDMKFSHTVFNNDLNHPVFTPDPTAPAKGVLSANGTAAIGNLPNAPRNFDPLIDG